MKSGNKFLQWLTLVLCVVMAAGVLAQTAGAAEPTGKCTNAQNEGVEYFTPYSALAKDADKWRAALDVTVVKTDDNTTAGTVVGMEVEIVNDPNRYQCTQILPSKTEPKNVRTYTCNSMPANALINGIYFLYQWDPTITIGSDINFIIKDALTGEDLYSNRAKVALPPYPCARNFDTRDLIPSTGKQLVFYTDKDCKDNTIDKQVVEFSEAKDPYAIVNILDTATTIEGGTIKIEGDKITNSSPKSRVWMDVINDAQYDFEYELELQFKTFANDPKVVTYKHIYNTTEKRFDITIDSTGINGLKEADLPLTLTGGKISKAKAVLPDGWGKLAFPPDAKFDIFFWYENLEGTLGYQNSVFHFERYLNIQFSPTCKNTAAATAFYDPCQATRQMFTTYLSEPIKINSGTNLWSWDTPVGVVKTTSDKDIKSYDFFFMTRKCVNADCSWTTSTNAYPYSVAIADGAGSERNYGNLGLYHDTGTRTLFKIRPYGDETAGRPFTINGVRLVAEEPGTYVIYPFAKYSDRGLSTPENYLFSGDSSKEGRIFVTVNDKDQLSTCSTPANNGYFRANWNDCLDSGKTQLLTFEHIPGKEDAWIENRSAHDIYFPYVEEWSYLPQKLQIASLNFKATALSEAGQPGRARCTPEGCLVPPYTRITINSGTFYLESAPKFDEYRVAYARRDTYNISHLFFNVYVKECEKKIPNTGISLRSPLKVNERLDTAAPVTSITRNSFQSPLKVNARVNNATDFVFTGNALRIPAIGLGMETPIPIVHVYYEDGSDGMKWDLSTLGNYVGELEGGSYIPYGGNSVLTGHYWSGGVFKNLEHLNLEDEIYVYGNDGVKYVYKVVQKFIAQPEDVYEMFQQVGERSLTLVTCENYNLVTDEYERRYLVRAVLESQDLYEEGIW